jgi:hypothetical protein
MPQLGDYSMQLPGVQFDSCQSRQQLHIDDPALSTSVPKSANLPLDCSRKSTEFGRLSALERDICSDKGAI